MDCVLIIRVKKVALLKPHKEHKMRLMKTKSNFLIILELLCLFLSIKSIFCFLSVEFCEFFLSLLSNTLRYLSVFRTTNSNARNE